MTMTSFFSFWVTGSHLVAVKSKGFQNACNCLCVLEMNRT